MVMSLQDGILLITLSGWAVFVGINVYKIVTRSIRNRRETREANARIKLNQDWWDDLHEGDRLLSNDDETIVYIVKIKDASGEKYIEPYGPGHAHVLWPGHRVYFAKLERSGPW